MPLVIDRTKLRLKPINYRNEVTAKDLIVLHFTAGQSAASAYWAWTAIPDRIATAYLVDLDGKVYETFDPARWAHHLGVAGPVNANFLQDRRSIGIEIVNVGGLKPDRKNPEQLNWWPSRYSVPWCRTTETDRYVKRSFRGLDYFPAFPEAQFDSACELVNMLADAFRIARRVPPETKREQFDLAYFGTYQGIASHQNFHAEKTDIGPAWDWKRFIERTGSTEAGR
ncbi:MAG: N-acetylmuramoyl-L-alanine amidase [Bryobacteraceae bacterium]|nr:N-acetylmuramoyl-L-alanine amidase [Bryobacteraceae bacterium]